MSAPPLLLTDEGRRVVAKAMEAHAAAAMGDYHDCDDAERQGPLLAAAHLAREHAIAFRDAAA